MTDTSGQELEQPPQVDDGVERWSQFRRSTRWVARIGFLVLLAILVLWQGTTAWTALAACTGATLLLWVLSIPCVPHRRSTPTSFWLWLALGTWTTLHLVPLPIGVVGWLNPAAAELHTRMAAAAGLPVASSLPLAGLASTSTSRNPRPRQSLVARASVSSPAPERAEMAMA